LLNYLDCTKKARMDRKSAESVLIQMCISGDRKSQKHLYEMYCSKTFAICLRYSKNQMDAEDVLQEGFVKLFNNLHRFRNEGSFDGWVRRIFVNTAIEHLRRKQLAVVELNEVGTKIKNKQNMALENLYEKDLIKTTMALSPGYRTVFHLYAVEGYSHKDIAKKLGIAEGTSKSQYTRARAILRKAIDRNASDRLAV
jgi:RNA polymerase sigma factor (sigma-70 family)